MAKLKTNPRSKAAKTAKPSTSSAAGKKKASASKGVAKKAATKKTVAKKAPAKKAPAKKAPVKKAPAKKAPAKKAPAKKAPAKKAPVKKAPAKKAPAKKAPAKKAPAKKAPAKKAPATKATVPPTRPVKVEATSPAVTPSPKPATPPARPAQAALKQRYRLEFYLNASVASLYEHISTPSGFSKWFCDDLNVMDNMYTFNWGQETEVAECIGERFGEYIRFRWVDDIDEDPAAYFEFRIRIDGMTNETCLEVTDHVWPKDLEEDQALWESQIQTLTRVLGA
ncbi:MAG: START-like domain-containing protein [Flavobacteriales bacterium]